MATSLNNLQAMLLILIVFISHTKLGLAARNIEKTSLEFIKTSCGSTSYPQLCVSSLSTHASAIQNSPKLLTNTALSVTLDNAKATSTFMETLLHSHGLTRRQIGAMKDCIEEMRASVDQLRSSLQEMNQFKGSDFGLMINDVQTWVSAALTDEDTCTDAGNAMNGNLKNKARTYPTLSFPNSSYVCSCGIVMFSVPSIEELIPLIPAKEAAKRS
ncbi:Pectinesterase inhibitor domain [Dillenia turbinata]|uniref:Pectinesterase inhibitor domain n=1 Tax=Dillenia turbinata TaxID=194707 RepID=A0AAN8VY37_9MAGN